MARNKNHKKRMVIDYSQTINRFTLLDAYPLPRIDDTINAIAQYQVFSTNDLCLYQFTRIPLGVTNGVACFQRIMTDIIAEEKLQGTIVYLDNVTICGKDQEEHDENLKRFQDVASRRQITYNDGKSVFSTRQLAILGYIVEEGKFRPDPERLRPCSSQLRTTQKVFAVFSDFFPTTHHGFNATLRRYDLSQRHPLSLYPERPKRHLKT